MKKTTKTGFSLLTQSTVILLGLFTMFSIGCKKVINQKELKDFQQVNLVDNNGKFGAMHSVGSMMNAWGACMGTQRNCLGER